MNMAILDAVVSFKRYMSLGASYLSMVNTSMIVVLILKNSIPSFNLWVWGIPVMICTALGFFLIGWFLEGKMQLFVKDMDWANSRNIMYAEIRQDLKEIKEKVGLWKNQ